jgi:hypothetical protein
MPDTPPVKEYDGHLATHPVIYLPSTIVSKPSCADYRDLGRQAANGHKNNGYSTVAYP